MKAGSLFVLILLLGKFSAGQVIADSCFSSPDTGTTFTPTSKMVSFDADLLEWTGSSWAGGWQGAGINIPPPNELPGCRAVFVGSGTDWTTGGEGIALRLSDPLVPGETYTYEVTYVSHGTASDSNFSPEILTNSTPTLSGADFLGNLDTAGPSWTTNAFTFEASGSQSGHTWLIIHTGEEGSSGLIGNFCEGCRCENVDLGGDTALCVGEMITLDAAIAGPDVSYVWQDHSTGPTLDVFGKGTYWVEVNSGNCVSSDTVIVEERECETVLEMPNIFTPNNDGVNDRFRPREMKNMEDLTFQVYNRWGQKIYESRDIAKGWNGKHNGKDCSDGTYYWRVLFVDANGRRRDLKGFLTLSR